MMPGFSTTPRRGRLGNDGSTGEEQDLAAQGRQLSAGGDDSGTQSARASAPSAGVQRGREEPPRSESELIWELRTRVAMLESETRDRIPRRQVSVTARSVVEILAMILGVIALVGFVSVAWGAITFVLIALLVALALNPAVEFFVSRGLRRGWAAGLVFLLALLAVGLLGLVLIPPLVTQVSHFIDALPGTLDQLSKGHGPLGFLERKFHVVQEANKLLSSKSLGSTASGVAGSGVGVALAAAGTVIGLVVIAFMTFFMLLEGPTWVERLMSLLPESVEPRCRRIGAGISRTVSGFVAGNLLASLLAGAITTAVFFVAGLPYPIPLGVLVGFLDLLPIFGAFIALVIVAAVAFAHGIVTGLIVTGVVFIYHQVEVYYLRPIIYGRMIELSPLAILVAATIGTEVAGPLGAIASIPVGGAIQLVLVEVLDARNERRGANRRPEAASGSA
jgi:predicted PurR-regulated permease PerM